MRHLLLTPACLLIALSMASASEQELSGQPAFSVPKAATAKAETWEFNMEPSADQGGATLTLGRLTVLYEGEAFNGSASGTIDVFGSGCSQSQAGSLKLSSKPKELRVVFHGKTLILTATETGVRIKLGNEAATHELAATGRMTIRFANGGKAEVSSDEPKPTTTQATKSTH